MENENENLDSLNEEQAGSENDDSAALKEKNRQLFERAKKAETEAKELKAFKAEAEAKAKAEAEKAKAAKADVSEKPNEPDYARLAYLETKGIAHPDDQKIVQDEADRLRLPLTDVLAMEHIKARLQANQDERTAKAGIPKGNGRSGGAAEQTGRGNNPATPFPGRHGG